MVGTFLSKSLLLLQLVSALSTGHAASTPLYKDASAPVEDRVSDLLGRMTIEDKMAQLMQGLLSPWFSCLVHYRADWMVAGDITNWMNSTSGAFNYTGLVENMKMKAGSFYGRGSRILTSVNDSVDDVFSWLSRFLGLDCYECQESPGLSPAEHDAWDSGACPD
jgi:hypothetical protein